MNYINIKVMVRVVFFTLSILLLGCGDTENKDTTIEDTSEIKLTLPTVACTQDSSYISTSNPELSALRTFGNKIYDASCNKYIEKGVWFGYYIQYQKETFARLKNEWGINTIRIMVHPKDWQSSEIFLEKYIDDIVENAGEVGLYVTISWHAHGNIITGYTSEDAELYNPDLELAKSALDEISSRYASKEWVMYSTFNEPAHITWDEWKPYAELLSGIVLENNPRAITYVSGIYWGQDLYGALSNPVDIPNSIYEGHKYPVESDLPSGVSPIDTVTKLSQLAPVVMGEWGFDSAWASAEYLIDNYAIPFVELAQELDVGWSMFMYVTGGEPQLVEYYGPNIEVLTDSGCFIREYLKGNGYTYSASVCNDELLLPEGAILDGVVENTSVEYSSIEYIEHYTTPTYHHLSFELKDLHINGVLHSPSTFIGKLQFFDGKIGLELGEFSGMSTLTSYAIAEEWGDTFSINSGEPEIGIKLKLQEFSQEDLLIIEYVFNDAINIITTLLKNPNIDNESKLFWNNNLSMIESAIQVFFDKAGAKT